MSELAILLTRVLSISKFSTILLKCFIKISAISTLSPIILLLLFKIMDSLRKAFSKRKEQTVFQNFLLWESPLWFSVPKKRLLVLRSKLTQTFLWRLNTVPLNFDSGAFVPLNFNYCSSLGESCCPENSYDSCDFRSLVFTERF